MNFYLALFTFVVAPIGGIKYRLVELRILGSISFRHAVVNDLILMDLDDEFLATWINANYLVFAPGCIETDSAIGVAALETEVQRVATIISGAQGIRDHGCPTRPAVSAGWFCILLYFFNVITKLKNKIPESNMQIYCVFC